MKKITIKAFDKIIVSLLALLGIFSSCDNKTICEYGTPHAEFEIKGTVKNKANMQPLQGIRVIRQRDMLQIGLVGKDTLYTDTEGKYSFGFNDVPPDANPEGAGFRLKIEDVDGIEKGGHFATQEVDVAIGEGDQVKKSKGWFAGKFVKTQDVELEEQE